MKAYQARVRASLAFAAAIGACRGFTGPILIDPSSDLVNGTWVRENEIPGSGEEWSLLVQDTLVTGAGAWTLETCCGGTEAIVGHVRGASLHLSVTSTRGPGGILPSLAGSVTHSEYVAVLSSPTAMSVTESANPGAAAFRMRKRITTGAAER